MSNHYKIEQTEWDTLDEYLDGMTYPARRKHDLGWLRRNLRFYNLDHANLDCALKQIDKMSRLRRREP